MKKRNIKIMQSKKLLGQIILKKKIMYERAKHFGYKHPSVLECSKELDVLLNQYQKIQEFYR
jgi:stage 0 sporulation regulatory protein